MRVAAGAKIPNPVAVNACPWQYRLHSDEMVNSALVGLGLGVLLLLPALLLYIVAYIALFARDKLKRD